MKASKFVSRVENRRLAIHEESNGLSYISFILFLKNNIQRVATVLIVFISSK